MRKEYDRRRKYIVKRLNEIGLNTIIPNGAFYAFSNIKPFAKSSYKFASDLLNKQKVAVVPGTEFGKYGEGYIRFSYATDIKLIEKGLDKVEKFLRR
jgi:aspartate/methionine/tyrosine aminotransferase